MRFAEIDWQDNVPSSIAFDDVYFSRADGIAESRYVFLEGCELAQSFTEQKHSVVAETGFGTGLNFLCTAEAFLRCAPEDATLQFISVERYPLAQQDMQRAHAMLCAHAPELEALSGALRKVLPLPVAGWHRLSLGRITLLLGYGDATALYASLTVAKNAAVKAWYLDGFSPAKNPQMWQPELYAQIARLSTPDARLASFTAAGHVRAGLEAVGFSVRREKGFGHKRHCIRARFSAAQETQQSATAVLSRGTPETAVVIGGGLAGTSLAHALASRGIAVTLLERAHAIASAASGNPAGVLYPQLTRDARASAQFSHLGYAHTLRLLEQLKSSSTALQYARIGMLKTPKDDKERVRLLQVNEDLGYASAVVRSITREEASERMGVAVTEGGAWYPHGTWVAPKTLCESLLLYPAITRHVGQRVTRLTKAQQGWRVHTNTGAEYMAACVVIAAAQETTELLPERAWQMFPSAGQISLVPNTQLTGALNAIWCHRGYIIPSQEMHLVGATYDHVDLSCAVTKENHERNRAELENAWADALRNPDTEAWQGRTSIRATTRDRMPYLGQAAEGLYVSTGHGSRGLITAPLCAEILAEEICGGIAPIAHTLRAALQLAR